ncbi:uncharacterized protein LOC120348632 isoform X2 [Styela clava]
MIVCRLLFFIHFLFIILSTTIYQTEAQDTEDKDICRAASGWAYSASSSSSGAAAAAGGGGGGASSASAICIQAKVPSDCIRAHPGCSWCAQADFSGQRCNVEGILQSQECSKIFSIKSEYTMEVSSSSSSSQRFSTRTGEARIRVGDTVSIPFLISEPKIYPVDFYYLMDVSRSMLDDLRNIQSLGTQLVKKLRQLTQGGEDSVRLGFGKFVDKVQSPMTQMTPYKLIHPYEINTDAPFLFKNVVRLTSNIPKFEETLKKENVSGNLDPPEGALDAMLQVVECKDVIGWRENTLRLLMVATESAFHYADDGAGYLSGIVKANDGKCYTDKATGKYTKAEEQDYPSISQVVRAVEKNSITPIFAVKSLYSKLYQSISDDYFKGSTAGELSDKSENLLQLVEEAYNKIAGKQELVTNNPNDTVLCPWYTWSVAGNAPATLSVDGAIVDGLESGTSVNYSLFLSANRGSCLEGGECGVGNVVIKTRRYDDRMTVATTVLGAFDCEKNVEKNSSTCFNQGNYFCGICVCATGWTGPRCNVPDVVAAVCPKTGAKDCSGRGTYVNGRCQCDPAHRHKKGRIFGPCCECDECPKRAGRVCSNHGEPTIKDCSCSCECHPGWMGPDCSCQMSDLTCKGQDGLTCSGRGECYCGRCVCDETLGYGGPTCNSCLVNCPTCAKFQDCVQCVMYGTGPKNNTCRNDCTEKEFTIQVVDTESIDTDSAKESGHEMCAALDESNNCKFYFKYKKLADGNIEIFAEKEQRCKPVYSLIIVLWCILLVLLIGLILLCCWRCCVYVIDKEEEKNYRLSNLAPYTIPLLPAMGAGSVIEFIKAKYLIRKSAKVAVIPVRRNFFAGKSSIKWKTYAGSAGDDDFEVINDGEEGTLARKRRFDTKGAPINEQVDKRHIEEVERVPCGDEIVEMEPLVKRGGNGAAMSANDGSGRGGRVETIDETEAFWSSYDWGNGELTFSDEDEFASIEIPLVHNFPGREIMFWVELYQQEKGVALGLKRTKVIVIKDEDAGVIGFPKPSYVFKENDERAVVPVHRTIGMDGKVSVRWFTRDITAIDKQHYHAGNGTLTFEDGEVTKHIDIDLIPDVIYDDVEKAFNIELEDPKGGASLDISHCMVTVLCNEECAVLQFAKTAYPFMENCGVAEIPVVRTRSTKGVCTVKWRTEDVTAYAGKDYVRSEGVLTFPNAVTEAHIQVPIIDNDEYDETGRSFVIKLYDPSESTKLAQSIATISIIEDDEPGMFEFAKTSIVLRKTGPDPLVGHLPVVRSLGTDGHITIPWIIQAHDNEELPSDVSAMSGSVEFAHSEITHPLDLYFPDVPREKMFSFDIILMQPTGGGKLGAKSRATVTVFGDEDEGTVYFAQPRFDAMAASGMATLLVSRKGNIENAAFVMNETNDISAVSGTHYRGGISSIVFEANEAAKEVGIPIYNDPTNSGRPLTFGVSLKSPPGGPKIGDCGFAEVVITCTELAPITPVKAAAPTGSCTVELLKSKYLIRRSAKTAHIPVHKSSADGTAIVEWTCIPAMSASSLEATQLSPMGKIKIPDGSDRSDIVLDVSNLETDQPQISLCIILLNVWWSGEEDITDDLELGKEKAEVIVLNDIDPGTLGFSKGTYSFKSNDGQVSLPVHRLGGMDGDVAVEWFTRDDTARVNEDYRGDRGVIEFGNNEIVKNVPIQLLPGHFAEDEREKQFTVELGQASGGAKTGTRMATIKILGGEDQSFVQFSKESYPVIGTSTSIKIPVLRTGDSQNEASVEWYTEDGTARQGIDYKLCRDILIFPANSTRAEVEIPLSGQTTEPRTFNVYLASLGMDSNVLLGKNKMATIAIISSREPGTFEFNKQSYIFKTTGQSGLVPVVRSNGTDGEVTLPWKIESAAGEEQSPFAGAEGFLNFDNGQISASVEIELRGVPSTSFVLVLCPPVEGGKLGATSQAVVQILGEKEEPIIEMASPTLGIMSNEVVKATVVRHGNPEEMACVGWKTEDGTAVNGKHFIGGSGNVVLDPGVMSKDIVVPIICPPTDDPASFYIRLTDVMGMGKLGETKSTEVTMEPMQSKYMDVLQQSAAAPETYVEFLRKRHHFQQSLGTALVPVHRSDTRGVLAIRWETENISRQVAKKGLSPSRGAFESSSSSEDEDAGQRRTQEREDDIDWGAGIITFEDGDRETAIELILYRDLQNKDSNFKISLIDPWDKVNFGVRETIVTVLKDRDAGSLGFAKPMYEFSCSDRQLVVPVHRSSGADGTVSVPWFTRDGSAVGGTHYLPDDGNLVFRDGEVVQKIVVPMPMRTPIFGEDEVAFDVVLGEPTGGATLDDHETKVVLKNDIVPSSIGFLNPTHECPQSDGTVSVTVIRSEGTMGKVTVPWRVVSAPGKPRSRYEGTNDTVTFKDNEDQKSIELPLPKGLLPAEQDFFVLVLDEPKSGRAQITEVDRCYVTIDNDITMGTFSLSSESYSFSQSEGRGCVTVIRNDGTEGEASLSWKLKSNSSAPTILHNKRGVVEFNPGQNTAKIEIPLPKDSEHDQESYILSLSPPGGRGKLGEPKQAEVLLVNDVESSIGFPQPLFETQGDVDTFMLPVVREGPKGRPVTVQYEFRDGTAKDLQHYIGEKGSIDFDAGEDAKNILIPILNDPDGDRVVFEVELHSIEGPGKLSGNANATIAIDNLAGPGIFIMAASEMDVNQSSGTACITILRTHGRKGIVEVPWFLEQVQTAKGTRKPSNYDTLEGKLTFNDGEGQKILEIPLETTPQDSDVTKFDAVLLTPTNGSGATLGDVTSTTVTVNNDLDGGTLEMAAEKVEVSGTDKEVVVPVVRTGAIDNKCYVSWEAEDMSAVRGKHYKGGRGNVSFEPGEKSKKITIPIVNDPTGEDTSFNVCLGETKGGAKLGEKTKTEVVMHHIRENGEICFDETITHVRQTEKKIVLTLIRKTGSVGRVVVPWSVKDAPENSPYYGMQGQEKFNDGETESHIEINPPAGPQENDQETFKVVLGQPIGGAFLTGECECSVSVENDVPYSYISFADELCEVQQSHEHIELPLIRSKRTEGRVRVPWTTKTDTDASYYADLNGVEVFENGEKKSHIEVQLSKVPSETDTDTFQIVLNEPRSPDAKLGDIQCCTIVIHNDIELPLVTFGDQEHKASQSESRTYITIKRIRHPTGRVIVPWKLVPDDPESPYAGIVGETVLEDGETEGVAEIHLPQVPLDKPEDNVVVLLEDPIGAKLADNAICKLSVNNDVGVGIVEMRSPTLTCCSDDGRASVVVVRKMFQDFPAKVKWVTEDEDAHHGVHYENNGGQLEFRPGEAERPIPVGLINDPTGETRHFKVKLMDLQGRDKLGDISECRVRITNQATPPPPVRDFQANLVGPQTVLAKWSPLPEGTPLEGYKVTYWSGPGTSKTVKVGQKETEVTLDSLEASTTYQILVCPYNDVGDGQTSDKIIVDTEPEMRLSYDSPMQFKTSMNIARFTIERKQTNFRSTVECRLIKETQKKLPRSYDSSSESDDERDGGATPIQTTELTFEPGQSRLTVEVPLEQKMKKSSQVYYMKIFPKNKDKALANIELHIINDTGVPGHVRRPFCAASTSRDCVVTWEPPIGGGPVKGYYVVARSEGLRDIVKNVSDGSTKVLLENLEPSTTYSITVQPYNDVGKGKPSTASEATTQDEMKVEFTQKFYTFKMSDKVAVIPIQRHFTHGYATLKWHTTWSKTQEEAESSSSSEEEEPESKAWASGTLSFADGQKEANVQIPLRQAQTPTQKKRSFFWLYVLDPNRRKRLASMKCSLIDDKVEIEEYQTQGDMGPPMFGFSNEETSCCALYDDTISVIVERTGDASGDAQIIYSTRDNTAIAGRHYTQTEGILLFDDGETSKAVTIPILSDMKYEDPLSFTVELGYCSAGEDAVDLYETKVNLEPTSVDVTKGEIEGDPGMIGFRYPRLLFSGKPSRNVETSVFKVPVDRTEGTHGVVSVDYFTRDNTAIAGVHYIETQGELAFKHGQRENDIEIKIVTNVANYKDLSFNVELGGTTGDADVGLYESEVVIEGIGDIPSFDQSLDDTFGDIKPLSPDQSMDDFGGLEQVQNQQMSPTQYTGEEGVIGFTEEKYKIGNTDNEAVVTVERLFNQSGPAKVEWFTRENKAIASIDYVESHGTLIFSDGQRVQNIHVPILNRNVGDDSSEKDFIVELGECQGQAVVGQYEATVAIVPGKVVSSTARITAPKNVELEASGPESVIVTWNTENVSAQEYWVSYKRAGSRDDASRRTVNPATGRFELTDLKPESTYAIVLTAIGEGGKQASTEVMSCTTPGNLPGPPNRLVFQVLSPSSLQCSWGEPANPNGTITSYEVMYQLLDKSKNEPPVLVRIPDGHYRSLLVEDLRENEPYKYSVRAKNQWGYGEFRHADMKIEHVGTRPPSALFLDANDTTYIQQQEEFIRQQQQQSQKQQQSQQLQLQQSQQRRQVEQRGAAGGDMQVQVSATEYAPTDEITTTQMTKTRVTRYRHKEGQAEPEVKTMEFDGRLSQQELQKMAEEGGRLEVQVVTYNTTQRKQTGGGMQSYQEVDSGQYSQQQQQQYRYQEMDPEYRSDSRKEVHQDVEEFTDVQESKEGDADVTTITKTYKTTTTERQHDTRSGVRKVVLSPQPKK